MKPEEEEIFVPSDSAAHIVLIVRRCVLRSGAERQTFLVYPTAAGCEILQNQSEGRNLLFGRSRAASAPAGSHGTVPGIKQHLSRVQASP